MSNQDRPKTASPTADQSGTSAKTGTRNLEQEVEALRQDMSRLTSQLGQVLDKSRSEAMTQMGVQAQRARAGLESMVGSASETGREAVDSVKDVVNNFSDALEESLRRRPLTTLSLAAALGFLFGAAWRR